MAGFLKFIKVIILPFIIASALYFAFTIYILPFLRRNRSRYDEYLPMQMSGSNVSTRISAIRESISRVMTAFILPTYRGGSSFGIRDGASYRAAMPDDHDLDQDEEDIFGDEEAEDMVGFQGIRDLTASRREEMARELHGMQDASRSVETTAPV